MTWTTDPLSSFAFEFSLYELIKPLTLSRFISPYVHLPVHGCSSTAGRSIPFTTARTPWAQQCDGPLHSEVAASGWINNMWSYFCVGSVCIQKEDKWRGNKSFEVSQKYLISITLLFTFFTHCFVCYYHRLWIKMDDRSEAKSALSPPGGWLQYRP